MLRIASDKSINGHSFAIVPRDDHKQGFIDAELDDEQDGTYWDSLQKVTLAASIRSSVSEVDTVPDLADFRAGSGEQAVVERMSKSSAWELPLILSSPPKAFCAFWKIAFVLTFCISSC